MGQDEVCGFLMKVMVPILLWSYLSTYWNGSFKHLEISTRSQPFLFFGCRIITYLDSICVIGKNWTRDSTLRVFILMYCIILQSLVCFPINIGHVIEIKIYIKLALIEHRPWGWDYSLSLCIIPIIFPLFQSRFHRPVS